MHIRRQRGSGQDRSEGKAPEGGIAFDVSERDTAQIFSVPEWLRNAGLMAWLLVGVAFLLVGLVWLVGLTAVIVVPVITAAIVASVASPVITWLQAHRVPRALGSVMMLLAVIGITFGMLLVVVLGITGQATDVSGHLDDARKELTGWAKDLGLNPEKAENAGDDAGKGATDSVSALLSGAVSGIKGLTSLVFFLAMTLLSLFFLLKDGPQIRRWGESHSGIPSDLTRIITQRVIGSLRGYFLGVTIVALFNTVVVTIGALVLGVPLIGTIAAVTFVGAYIPYIGAWTAGAFAVLLALGGAGTDAAAGMIVVQLLANGILQQLVQPFAMGAALGIHPLAVLIVTIAGGALFGTLGLILAAPLTAAATRILSDVAAAKAAGAAEGEPPPEAVPGVA
jgi:predicted PurR-regulated permease PerM